MPGLEGPAPAPEPPAAFPDVPATRPEAARASCCTHVYVWESGEGVRNMRFHASLVFDNKNSKKDSPLLRPLPWTPCQPSCASSLRGPWPAPHSPRRPPWRVSCRPRPCLRLPWPHHHPPSSCVSAPWPCQSRNHTWRGEPRRPEAVHHLLRLERFRALEQHDVVSVCVKMNACLNIRELGVSLEAKATIFTREREKWKENLERKKQPLPAYI